MYDTALAINKDVFERDVLLLEMPTDSTSAWTRNECIVLIKSVLGIRRQIMAHGFGNKRGNGKLSDQVVTSKRES
jgi:hypothetical protein